ncbi:MAG: DNA-binding protein [Clostridiales bacterium]|nr:DNA-binding protein [Clostridiales bacterium]
MEKIVRQSLLYDFYGELLTNHQKSIYEDFVLNDIGISEIAALRGISRQGVHDLIRRCDATLENYEDTLKLIEKFLKIKSWVTKIHTLTGEFDKLSIASIQEKELVDQINDISNQILDEI